jgi:hypothetical protein
MANWRFRHPDYRVCYYLYLRTYYGFTPRQALDGVRLVLGEREANITVRVPANV